MKGSTIAAMVMAAAAASAATIFALKKAHDKKLENACNCDDLPEGGCCCTEDDTENAYCCTESDAETDCCDADETTMKSTEDNCCSGGVCSFDADDDDAVDQPSKIQMPENLNKDETDSAENA